MKNEKLSQFEKVLYSLPLEELKSYLKEYDKRNNTNIQKSLNTVNLSEIQAKVESVGLQPTCPCCGSHNATKRVMRGNTPKYLCLDCNNSYTIFSNTFAKGSTLSWDTWVKLLQLTIGGKSIEKKPEILEDAHDLEGTNKKSILYARHKLLYAMATMQSQPSKVWCK